MLGGCKLLNEVTEISKILHTIYTPNNGDIKPELDVSSFEELDT